MPNFRLSQILSEYGEPHDQVYSTGIQCIIDNVGMDVDMNIETFIRYFLQGMLEGDELTDDSFYSWGSLGVVAEIAGTHFGTDISHISDQTRWYIQGRSGVWDHDRTMRNFLNCLMAQYGRENGDDSHEVE